MTLTKSGSFLWAGGGKNGAVVDLWLASRFSSQPAEDDPPPPGVPDAGPVTTDISFGGPGAYTIDVTVVADYYQRAIYNGVSYWGFVPAGTIGGNPVTSGGSAVVWTTGGTFTPDTTNLFTGTGAVLLFLPNQPGNGTTITFINQASDSGPHSLSTQSPDTINNFGTIGNVSVPYLGTISMTYYTTGNVWQVTESGPSSGGSGSVTTVSVATANGYSGTVANATTTPAITLTGPSALPPNGSAGGDLTGTYPSPSLAAAGPGPTGPIGDGTHVPVVTIDGKGRVTGLTSTSITSGGSGTVTTVSVVSANGLAGTVANATSTPALTLSTTVTGILKGNGTTISAATAGTDYLTPSGNGSSLTGITQSQVSGSAPLASPTFTGTVTIPNGAVLGTPASGTLTNCTFPTLNQNTSGTAANLSGTPTLPNGTAATPQAALDNSTKWATTAYADTAVGVESTARKEGFLTLVSKTTTYPILTTDCVVLCNASSAAFTVTLPTAASVTGKQYTIKKTDTSLNVVTVATTSGQTIDGYTTNVIATPYESVTVVSDGTNWNII